MSSNENVSSAKGVEAANAAMHGSDNGVNRGGFALDFDRVKRKMREKDIELKKLMTCIPGTEDYEAYMALFLAETNTGASAIDVWVEDDNRTTTFYLTIPHTNSDIFNEGAKA